MQYLATDQEVIYVDPDKKTHKAKIIVVLSSTAAHVEFKGGSAVAELSDKKEPNTFHFEQASPKAESTTEAKKTS